MNDPKPISQVEEKKILRLIRSYAAVIMAPVIVYFLSGIHKDIKEMKEGIINFKVYQGQQEVLNNSLQQDIEELKIRVYDLERQ